MDKRYIFFALLIVFSLIFISYKVAFSFFSDSASSSSNTFTAATTFPTPSPTTTPTPSTSPSPSSSPAINAGDVVVNEVHYDLCTPASTCGTEPHDEWVELFNKTNSPINLKNWTLTDNQSTETLSITDIFIPANGFVLISDGLDTWSMWSEPESTLKVALGESIGNGLHNDGDRLILKDSNGTTIDAMSYGDDTTQLNPAASDVAQGHSIERDPDGTDNNLGSDFVDRTTPTPGI